jgi:hypothetical protein
MVEMVNGTIKNNTILKSEYKKYKVIKVDLMNFMNGYNIYRKHGRLR